ncbi:class I SAM-dependent DNA methyltransferase [Alkalihalobacillus pseudalcaliphilus]|uniref:class I SAM-dependent DNA methyltransferase n=1 Tax=Alkalihalobacillus pseudalcaliphilus TaxID=79884 RepID=UPI00064E00E9|nr:class I SAM-dependent methyltransferase [Alkalihalobacillus pseudalcaliphilus]KMK75928.1 methyltransferase [Alkalihalobacillus pseudalcaliphilus]
MNYLTFAHYYDQLMAEAPYDNWLEFVLDTVGKDSLKGHKVLDVGCGTGELLLSFLKKEAEVTGLDLSAEMLMVAHAKAEKAGYKPFLIEQDMSEMTLMSQFDIVCAFCDSINYLENETDVQRTFAAVFKQLKQGGYFLFDVHSLYKITRYIEDTHAEPGEEISYIWNSFEGDWPDSVEHELTFFVRDSLGKYERFDELHKQRTYEIKQYEEWLIEAGFSIEKITADFTDETPNDQSERIFFKAIKK